MASADEVSDTTEDEQRFTADQQKSFSLTSFRFAKMISKLSFTFAAIWK